MGLQSTSDAARGHFVIKILFSKWHFNNNNNNNFDLMHRIIAPEAECLMVNETTVPRHECRYDVK